MNRRTPWARVAGVLVALLLVEACRDASTPEDIHPSPATAVAALRSTRTIRVTVTDSQGASGSDTKVVRVIL